MAEEKAVKNKVESAPETPKEKEVKDSVKAASEVQAGSGAPKAQPAEEAAKTTSGVKAEAKKEADPSREFVDGIMAEMNLKGASKKRLIKKLAEQYNFDRQKVLFKLKRALITERYAAIGH